MWGSDLYDRYTENRYGYCVVNKEAMKAFNACERTYNAMNRLFTPEQIEKLEEEIKYICPHCKNVIIIPKQNF